MFVIAGQSNASGRGTAADLPLDQQGPQSDVLYWYDTDRGASGTLPKPLVPLGDQFGPEIEAARILKQRIDDEIAIVKVACGGTSLSESGGRDWSPTSSGELYVQLVSFVDLAQRVLISQGKTVDLAAMLWVQGERDAMSGNLGGGAPPLPQPTTANTYESNLTQFIRQLRIDLARPQLPIFVGKINIGDDPTVVTDPDSPFNTTFGEYDFTPTVQSAQAAVAGADLGTYLIDTATFGLKTDYLHFDSGGQIALGAAFANGYLKIVPEPSIAVLIFVATLFPPARSLRKSRLELTRHRQQ